MLKEDVAQVMNVSEYAGFMEWIKGQKVGEVETDYAHRRVDYYEYDVHRYLDLVRGPNPALPEHISQVKRMNENAEIQGRENQVPAPAESND